MSRSIDTFLKTARRISTVKTSFKGLQIQELHQSVGRHLLIPLPHFIINQNLPWILLTWVCPRFWLLKVSFITYYMSLFRSCVEFVFAEFVLLFTFDLLRLKACFVDGKQVFLPTVTEDTTHLIYY